MRFWFDTEFHENGITIDLISIGVVCEDGSEFYAEVNDFDFSNTDPWLIENVKPYLTGETMDREEMAKSLLQFVMSKTDKPNFWAYYADYDWVVLCRLYGRMIDLPETFPMYCNDLKQELVRLGVDRVPVENKTEHNALADARWARDVHLWLERNYNND